MMAEDKEEIVMDDRDQERVVQQSSEVDYYNRLGPARQPNPGLADHLRRQNLAAGFDLAGTGVLRQTGSGRESLVAMEVQGCDKAIAILWQTVVELEQRLSPILAPMPPQAASAGGRGEAPRAPLSPMAEQLQEMRRKIHAAEAKLRDLVDRIEV